MSKICWVISVLIAHSGWKAGHICSGPGWPSMTSVHDAGAINAVQAVKALIHNISDSRTVYRHSEAYTVWRDYSFLKMFGGRI